MSSIPAALPMSFGVAPHLTVSNASAAIDFYCKALGATELDRNIEPNSGRITFARLSRFGTPLLLNDDFPEYMNGERRTPEAIGGSPIRLHLEVPDAIEAWDRAMAAGGIPTMPLKDQFWGQRYGQFRDPFGQLWSIGQTPGHVTQEELVPGAEASMQQN